MRPDADLSGSKDPPDMGEMIQRIQDFGWITWDECPLREDLIIAALRAASFHFPLAEDILFLATDQDPLAADFASTPRQEKYVRHCTSSDYRLRSPPEPVNTGAMVEALRRLPLTDEEGRPFCTEVLAAAVRGSYYRVFRATLMLLAASGQDVRKGFWGPYVEQDVVMTDLKRFFPELDWSSPSKASRDAREHQRNSVAALIEIGSQIEELEPEVDATWYTYC
jgi:hypothetical protein